MTRRGMHRSGVTNPQPRPPAHAPRACSAQRRRAGEREALSARLGAAAVAKAQRARGGHRGAGRAEQRAPRQRTNASGGALSGYGTRNPRHPRPGQRQEAGTARGRPPTRATPAKQAPTSAQRGAAEGKQHADQQARQGGRAWPPDGSGRCTVGAQADMRLDAAAALRERGRARGRARQAARRAALGHAPGPRHTVHAARLASARERAKPRRAVTSRRAAKHLGHQARHRRQHRARPAARAGAEGARSAIGERGVQSIVPLVRITAPPRARRRARKRVGRGGSVVRSAH